MFLSMLGDYGLVRMQTFLFNAMPIFFHLGLIVIL